MPGLALVRGSGSFQVRLHRFAVWRVAVSAIVAAAVLAVSAWALAMSFSHDPGDARWLAGIAALLAAAALVVGRSLTRLSAGVLSCRDGSWTFAPDAGHARSGPLAVAIDLGSFLLLRVGARGGRHTWLPVQRGGLEREWHALRCAVYSPSPSPSPAAGAESPASRSFPR